MKAIHEVLSEGNINKSALLSTMASELFQNNLNPRISLITATAYIGAIEYLDDEEMFIEAFVDGLEVTSLSITGIEAEDMPDDVMDTTCIIAALQGANYLTEEHKVGERLIELMELRSEAYLPALAVDGVERRFGYAPTQYSALFKEAIHALEDTKYTVDDRMLSIALQVLAASGKDDEEGYVLRGCEKMDSNDAYVSEFKGDRRGRMYQASCHGPNGQASDRSRALMDLYGVPRDYDVMTALDHLRHEMADMVSVEGGKERRQLLVAATEHPVEFILKHQGKEHGVSKPWSFVKAAKIFLDLVEYRDAGTDGRQVEKPYIGMAFGLDAKCSGPQLGALMVGDGDLAAACGFSMKEIDDAYIRAIGECDKAGFHNLTRNDIKKPFMGIFYGQGKDAFMLPDDMSVALWTSIHGETIIGNSKRAEEFHKAVTASFGAKMIAVREAMRSYMGKIEGKVSHYLPDGFRVAMNYKMKVNILGELMEYDTPKFDVRLRNNVEAYKFINMQMNTKEVHTGDFARNGFVNMVQGVDGLIARLIVVHLKRLGAQHIIAVHDCFRVNVKDMELLKAAIKEAYRDLFGSYINTATEDLPKGQDILGLYFDGINDQLKNIDDAIDISQFFTSGKRRLQKIHGEKLNHLISALGTTYYFDK